VEIRVKDVGSVRPEVSIIIPLDDFDTDFSKRCVGTLGQKEHIPYRLILVRSQGKEFAYGKSVNAGIREAGDSKYYVVMDNDTFIRENTIGKLLEEMKKDPRVGFCGPWFYNPIDESRIECLGMVHVRRPHEFLWNSITDGAPFYGLRRVVKGQNWHYGFHCAKRYAPGRMAGISSALCVLRRECYEEVGEWDERFRSSGVDIDYSFRVLLSDKWYITSYRQAEAVHVGRTTKRKYGHGDFTDLNEFIEKWSKEDIERVYGRMRAGKFLIPEDQVS
jgi:GT2 family glycosyltransferase